MTTRLIFLLLILGGASSQAVNLGIPVEEFGYRMEAHTLRTCGMVNWALQSADFLTKFPQYKNVRVDKLVAACTAHDRTKRQPPGQVGTKAAQKVRVPWVNNRKLTRAEVRKGLAKDWGLNKYELHPMDPRGPQMDHIIHDLNNYDTQASAKTAKALGLSKVEQALLADLEGASDVTDRTFNCPPGKKCAEFGKVAEPATKWAKGPKKDIAEFFESEKFGRQKYLQITNGLRDEDYIDMRKNNPKLQFRHIRKDFLQNPSVVAEGIGSSKAHWPEAIPESSRMTRLGRMAGKTVGRALPALGIGSAVYSARASGDPISEAVLGGFVGTGESSYCDSPMCSSVKDGSFMSLPLDQQMKTRAAQIDINKILHHNFPFVTGLSCQVDPKDSSVRASLIVVPDREALHMAQAKGQPVEPYQEKDLRVQNIVFDPSGVVKQASTETLRGSIRYEIGFTQGLPIEIKSGSDVASGLVPSYHRAYSEFKKEYPSWKAPLIFRNSVSAKRDQNVSQLDMQVQFNKQAIFNCCNDRHCLKFFEGNSSRSVAREIVGTR